MENTQRDKLAIIAQMPEDSTVALLTVLRKQRARIAEYEQIISEAEMALAESRRTYAIAQRDISRAIGLPDMPAGTPQAPAGAVLKPAKWHRRSYKLVQAALEQGGADTVPNMALRLGISTGSVGGACHRLIADGKVLRIGKGIYQAVKP